MSLTETLLYRPLFMNVTDATLVADASGCYLDANPAALELLGYTREELVQRRVHDVVVAESPWTEAACARMRREESWQANVNVRRKDGRLALVEACVMRIELPTGPVYLAILRTLAERKQTQALVDRITGLQEVTAALAGALTPTQVATVIIEQGVAALGAIAGTLALLTNDGTELEVIRAVGYPQEVLDDWQQFPITAPAPLAEAVRTRAFVLIESRDHASAHYSGLTTTRLTFGDGSIAAIPLLVDGRVIGGLGLSFAEVQGFNADDRMFMHTLAHQAAQAIERARLYEAEQQARAMAEAAVRMRDQFLAVVSHDLRNPLTVIHSYTQLLQKRIRVMPLPVNEQITKALTHINAAVTQMLAQINELLDISHLQAGQMPTLRCQKMDLVALAQRIADEHQQTAKCHRIQVEATVPQIIGSWDRCQLERLIANLLTNAIKYSSPDTDITLTVAQEIQAHNTWAVLMVQDQGIGIPSDDISHIFEPLYRSKNVTETIQGTGLGLASARQIIEQHGGTIAVTSAEGAGSTFVIRLPLQQAEADRQLLHSLHVN